MIKFTNSFYLVDSNIFIDFLLATKDDRDLNKVFNQPVYLNFAIFTETINFIQNRISFKEALEAVSRVIENPNLFIFLPITSRDLHQAVEINNKYYVSKIGFNDSLILSQAQNYSLKVLTQDIRMNIYPNVEVENPFTES